MIDIKQIIQEASVDAMHTHFLPSVSFREMKMDKVKWK